MEKIITMRDMPQTARQATRHTLSALHPPALGSIAALALRVALLLCAANGVQAGTGEIYWRVYSPSGLEDIKFRTAEDACAAGIKKKEALNAGKKIVWRVDGPYWAGGSYTWGNWGKMPGEPGFDDSSRQVSCRHEYKFAYESEEHWGTFWPYSGAGVDLWGDQCPLGTTWDRDLKGCVPERECDEPTSEHPVAIASGNKYFTEIDYQGSGPFALSFVRYYSSMLGGWRYSYQKSIVELSRFNEVLVVRPSGQRLKFRRVDGDWVPDRVDTGVIERLVDGTGTLTGWRYRARSQSIETYDEAGRLIAEEAPDGHTTTFTHADKLTTISADNGESIQIERNDKGKITRLIDPEGNVFHYTYAQDQGLDLLLGVTYPDATPEDLSDNPTRDYHYEDARFPTYITGITDENGHRSNTVAYDERGRATLSELADGAERVTLSYDDAALTTTLTNALGRQTTYRFQVVDGRTRLMEVEGDPTPLCAGSGRSYTYDANAYKASETDFNGNLSTYERDERGLELSRTEAVGTPEERTVTTEWDSHYRLPLTITEPGKRTEFVYDEKGRLLSRSERARP